MWCNSCFQQYDDQLPACPYCGYRPGGPANELFQLPPGTILENRYMVGQVIGFGGFGIIYKSYDGVLNRIVAIKEFYPSGLVNRTPGRKEVIVFTESRLEEYTKGVERFLLEARHMALFSDDPNIINVYEFFRENNTAYLVMEYLDGVQLYKFLKNNTLTIENSLAITLAVCKALKAIHAHHFIHRDVSPDNIFLCYDGTIKLIDFGAAHFSSDEQEKRSILIKPGFAPPEQYNSVSKQGPWTDIYALGATLYYMLTRHKPDESTNRKISDTLPPPDQLNRQVYGQLTNTVMKAMAVDERYRFQSVEEFEEALIGKKKIDTVAEEIGRKKKRSLWERIAAACLLLASISGLFFGIMHRRNENVLPDAAIELVYISAEDPYYNENTQSAFESIADVFCETYSNVSVKINGVGQSELRKYVRDNPGCLYESSPWTEDTSPFLADQSIDLGEIITDDIKDRCYFLDRYETLYPSGLQLPIGLSAGAVFENTDASLEGVLGNAVTEDVNGFLKRNAKTLRASTRFYHDIQALFVGHYTVKPDFDSAVTLSFKFSISENSTPAQRKAAKKLASFLLSEKAQDYLYLQHTSYALPINRSISEILGDVNNELNVFFEDSYIGKADVMP